MYARVVHQVVLGGVVAAAGQRAAVLSGQISQGLGPLVTPDERHLCWLHPGARGGPGPLSNSRDERKFANEGVPVL